ncbi:MAG: AAA family ATPase [Bdellovibrionales bacterium]|nr:AAA family ATPase [Bdellovibrionales bacterium]
MKRENQEILFITGKGGVGKTALAASLAKSKAQNGKKVLLVELGERSFHQYLFPQSGSYAPKRISGVFNFKTPSDLTGELWSCRWDYISCLKEYFSHILKMEKMVHLFFSSQIMETLLSVAPALNELALLGKITSGLRGVGPDMPYDCIVVDAFATGHFKALLLSPLGMIQAVHFGPMAEQCQNMITVLKQSLQVQYYIVSLPEELALNEAQELKTFLWENFKQKGTLIVNKVLPISPDSAEPLERELRNLSGNAFVDFTNFVKQQHRHWNNAKALLKSWKGPSICIPYYLTHNGIELIDQISSTLTSNPKDFTS